MPARRAIVPLLAVLLPGLAAPAAGARPRVTVFGDSVQASFLFTPAAVAHLGAGIDLRMQADACRKLVDPGCLGGSPPSVLTLANALGPSLGDMVIVHVGYNDSAPRYDADAVLRSLDRAGVKAVVWVELRESHNGYAAINARIRDTVRRAGRNPGGPVVRIADWNAFSAGRPWFTTDRVHLNPAGASGLAQLLRDRMITALAGAGIPLQGATGAVAATVVPAAGTHTIAGDPHTLWRRASDGLVAMDERTGRTARRPVHLAPSETLTSDGARAWVVDAARATATPAARRARGAGLTPPAAGISPPLGGTGRWLWGVTACDATAPDCPGAGGLVRVNPVTGLRRPVGGDTASIEAIAARSTAVWAVSTDDAGTLTLQRRAPVTGRGIRTVPLTGVHGLRQLATTPDAAWMVTDTGDLLRADLSGAVTRFPEPVGAVATAGAQVWVLRSDARTVERLAPDTGRVLLRFVSGDRLTDRMAVTSRHLWVLRGDGGSVLRIPRG